MRTTIDLPDELFRDAKIEAVNRGITLRELISGALEKEIHPSPSVNVVREHRVTFPLIKSKGPDGPMITDEMIREAEMEDDLRRAGLTP